MVKNLIFLQIFLYLITLIENKLNNIDQKLLESFVPLLNATNYESEIRLERQINSTFQIQITNLKKINSSLIGDSRVYYDKYSNDRILQANNSIIYFEIVYNLIDDSNSTTVSKIGYSLVNIIIK